MICFMLIGTMLNLRFRRLLGWLADISYPLYIVHEVNGYVIMRLSMRAGMPAWLALMLAAGFAFAAAWLLHVAIEVPSHRMGRRALNSHRFAAGAAT
jgi:peptidoglycan/LPS O-acetylase OafA/YrhL